MMQKKTYSLTFRKVFKAIRHWLYLFFALIGMTMMMCEHPDIEMQIAVMLTGLSIFIASVALLAIDEILTDECDISEDL